MSETRLCRGYFAMFARELRLNENLLYIPCTPFPLHFFSPAHILINSSFLRECNAREITTARLQSFYRCLFLFSSLFSLFTLLFFLHAHALRTFRIESNRGTREFLRRSCFLCHQSLLHPLCSMLRQHYILNVVILIFYFLSFPSLCIFQKMITFYL